jgi:hypothetical protein
LIYGTEPAADNTTGARIAATVNPAVAETAASKIMIYPNPVSGNRFYIKLNSEWFDKVVNVKVYNLYGAVVMSKVQSAGNAGVLEIRLDNALVNGVYMVQLNNRKAFKLVIER